ncbi:MAG: hypothetical protein ACE5R6_04560 [Candidatus Heimdallarchaeota archaeon]
MSKQSVYLRLQIKMDKEQEYGNEQEQQEFQSQQRVRDQCI